MVKQYFLSLKPRPRGFHIITNEIVSSIKDFPDSGLVNIFIKHTSAGLTINENADSSVRKDFEVAMNRIIIEGAQYYSHNMEGDDDMPAHLKASIIGSSVSIPITERKLNLGTWQGIYFCEFRENGGVRNLVVTVIS
mgnify:CR=1 FL=1